MTNEEINIAIAESLGWTKIVVNEIRIVGAPPKCPPPYDEYGLLVPNYAADLNACHEIEKTLDEMLAVHIRGVGVCTKAEIYYDMLGGLCDQPVRATARQRCEAYLRTIGKWKEKQ